MRCGAASAGIACVLMLVASARSAEDSTTAGAAAAAGAQPVLLLSFAEDGDQGRTITTTSVAIFPDGTVLVPEVQKDTVALRGELSAETLGKLLHDVVETNRLLECDTGEIESALVRESRRTGLAWRVPGAATTVVRVRWQGRDHEVRCPASMLLAARFPAIEELRRVCAVQRRLQNVKCIVQAGGVNAAERLAALANRELQSGGGDGLSVSVDDLQLVRSSGDGLCYAQFLVPGDAASGNAPRGMVSVIESPGAAPRVSVMPVPPSRP